MEGIWVGSTFGLFLVVATIIGAIKHYEGIVFWLGRHLMIWYWKNRKKWPVELKYIGGPPIVTYRNGFLDVELTVIIKVKDKRPKSKVDNIGVTLISNGHSWDGYEYVPVMSTVDYKKITDIKLSKLAEAEGEYSFLFREVVDGYFKELCEGVIATSIYGVVWIQTGENRCESNTFEIDNTCINHRALLSI